MKEINNNIMLMTIIPHVVGKKWVRIMSDTNLLLLLTQLIFKRWDAQSTLNALDGMKRLKLESLN